MEITRGQVVRSLAGHDKGGFLTVLEVAARPGDRSVCALVCDGKRRPLERPKLKKLFHLAPTKTVLPEEALKTNRQIRAALRPFQEKVGDPQAKRYGDMNVETGRN